MGLDTAHQIEVRDDPLGQRNDIAHALENKFDTVHINDKIVEVTRQATISEYLEDSEWLSVLDPIITHHDIPILFLDTFMPSRGGYHKEQNIILIPKNVSQEREIRRIIEHEITHALFVRHVDENESSLTELFDFYEEVKSTLTAEDVTKGHHVSMNFRKNIHEFMADVITQPVLIKALKERGLYDKAIAIIKRIYTEISAHQLN